MPDLGKLALRYLLWLIGLRLFYTLTVVGFGLPNLPSVGVILAAVPALDVGRVALASADRPLSWPFWVKVWGLCLLIFAALQVILPALLIASMREALAVPGALQATSMVVLATGAMLGLFLWLGARIGAGR